MKTFSVSSLLLSFALASPVLAAESEDAIVVTARKTEERLNDVPVSIRYIDGKDIVAHNVSQVSDLPGFGNRISTINSSSLLLSMHGQQQSDPHMSIDGAVATYVDNVYVARAYGLNTPLLDAKNVQVLYGPQGTMFGRNSTGGAILINSNDPVLNSTSTTAEFTYGRFNELQETGIANLPVSSSVAVRIAATKLDRDGYIKDTSTGIMWNDKNELHSRVKVLYSPASNLRLVLTGEYFNTSSYSDPRQRTSTGGVRVDAIPTNVVSQSFNAPSNTSYGSVSGVLEYDNFKIVGGWRKTRSNQRNDFDGAIPDVMDFSNHVDIQQYTTEATYTNTIGSLKYMMGAFVFRESGNDDLISSTNARTSNTNWYYYGVNTAYGAFTDVNYSFGKMNVTAGIRYTHDNKRATTHNLFLTSDQIPTSCVVSTASLSNNCKIDLNSSFDNVSWNTGINYNLDYNNMIYAKVATGYRAGGVNKASESSALAAFYPEKITEYSIGAKGTLGSITYGVSGFYSDVTDGQISAVFFIPGPVSVVKNAAKVHTYGGEASVDVAVTNNLHIRAAGLLAYPEYVSYIDPANNRDVSSSRFNMLIKEQFTIDGTYKIGKTTLNAAYIWTGKMPHTTMSYADILAAFNGNEAKAQTVYSLSETPSTGILNLRATYDFTPGMSVSVWGRNVLNERYFKYNFVKSSAFTSGVVNDPVTYGITIGAKF